MGLFDKFLDAIKLNDEYDDELFDEEFDNDFEEEEEETKPKKKFFDKFKKEELDNDDFLRYEEEPVKQTKQPKSSYKTTAAAKAPTPVVTPKPTKQPKQQSSKITPMRNAKKSTASMEVCVIKPVSMEDTREIADTLVDNCTVVLNLEGVDVELAQRIIDFTSGSCYSLGGSLQKISSYIFILTPYNVDVSGDFQNILGDAVPSIRSTY